MPYIEYPRVEENLVVTGTGAVTTGSTPVSGAQTFADVATIGDTFPLWIVDTSTSPPTIESSLGTYTAANTITRTGTLVSFLGNACSVFIARIPGGNAAQTLEVAAASTGTQAVALRQAQAAFAALAGLPTQTFNVADATASSHAVALGQAYPLGFLEPEVQMPLISDMNFAPLGWSMFTVASTINIPGSGYGVCFTRSKGGTLGNVVGEWIYQTAHDTTRGIYNRWRTGTAAWTKWIKAANQQIDNNFLVPQSLPAATATGHAVNLGQAQGAFAPILTVNAPVDQIAALDALATLYTNPGPTLWVDSIVAGTGAVAITVNAVLVATLAASTAISVTIPPGGTIQIDTTLPATWFRTTM